jgi:endonuclease-3
VTRLARASLHDVEKVIYSVNFYRNKARNVLACAKMLDEEYNGVVPHDFDKLIILPGVGRKTANVFLSELGKQAIAVDTHVYQISRYLGWSKQKDPHKVERDLRNLFPRNVWKKINPILVRFGKTYMSRKKKEILLDMIK